MAIGLEPSLCVRFYSQVRYPYNEFVHSIPSCFSKCIITTIRLSGSSWRTKTTFAPLISRLTTLVLSIHVILHKQFTDMFRSPIRVIPLCPTIASYSFASTTSTCCSHGLGTMNATLLLTTLGKNLNCAINVYGILALLFVFLN